MRTLEGRIRDVSLNIKNEATHAKVRRLAELTGMSMTAAVDDAVERRLKELGGDPYEERRARVYAAIENLRETLGPERLAALDPQTPELYDDETGLPI